MHHVHNASTPPSTGSMTESVLPSSAFTNVCCYCGHCTPQSTTSRRKRTVFKLHVFPSSALRDPVLQCPLPWCSWTFKAGASAFAGCSVCASSATATAKFSSDPLKSASAKHKSWDRAGVTQQLEIRLTIRLCIAHDTQPTVTTVACDETEANSKLRKGIVPWTALG